MPLLQFALEIFAFFRMFLLPFLEFYLLASGLGYRAHNTLGVASCQSHCNNIVLAFILAVHCIQSGFRCLTLIKLNAIQSKPVFYTEVHVAGVFGTFEQTL